MLLNISGHLGTTARSTLSVSQPSPAQPSPAQPSPARCVADLYQLSPVKSATLPGAGTRLHAGTTRVDTVCSVSAVVYYARYPQPEQKVVRFNLASNHHGLACPLLVISHSRHRRPLYTGSGSRQGKNYPRPRQQSIYYLKSMY